MGENEIYEAFGMTAPTDTDNGADTSETTVDTADNGETPTETTDSISEGEGGNTAEGNTATGEGTTNSGTEKTVQTPDQNAQYAAARRQAEQERDRAIADERAKADARVKEVIASLGIVSPYTGKPVTTLEEYEAYKSAKSADFKKSFMEKNGLDEKGYDEFVSQLPEVAAARDAISKADDAVKAAVREKAKAGLEAELEVISNLDPDIKDMDTLFKSEGYPAILAKVKSGNSLSDAYKLVNFDKLQQKSAAAEKQRALNSAAGRSHMTPTTQAHGQALSSVPDDVKASYRLFDPTMSEEDMARDYNKRMKSIK